MERWEQSCACVVVCDPGNKNDYSTVSITNTGCIRCDNRCREHLDKMFLFFDSFPVCIGICENHTGQFDLFLFFDLFQKERIDLDIFFAAVYVTQMLPCNFSLRARFIYQHTHRTATKPKTQNIRPHPTSKVCQYHRRRCLFRRCLRVRKPPPRALPPRRAPDDDEDDDG